MAKRKRPTKIKPAVLKRTIEELSDDEKRQVIRLAKLMAGRKAYLRDLKRRRRKRRKMLWPPHSKRPK